MLTRRLFAGCGLCAALGLRATGVQAQGTGAPPGGVQAPTVTRRIVQRTDLAGTNHESVLVIADIPAAGIVPRHTHPGIESSYVLEGKAELSVDGQEPRTIKAQDGFQIPAGVPHAVRTGNRAIRLVITYTVEKGKPLSSPA